VIEKDSDELFRHKVCPICGSDKLERYFDYLVDAEYGDFGEISHSAIKYPTIECLDCGWRKTGIDDDADKII
jgi:C4-type Zn-finger protein